MEEKMLSVVVPAYNEEQVIAQCHQRLHAVLEGMDMPYEIIYVNDGSRDATLAALRQIARQTPQVKVISLSRNFGHQLAVTAGMDQAKGDAVVIIDADLQDPPEVIPQMVDKWKAGAQIVYGRRIKREGETASKKLTAHIYYRILSAASTAEIPPDAGDFRLLDRKVADQFLRMREHSRYLRGMSAWMGYRSEPVDYVRKERAAGETKYTLKKMLKLALDGLTGFSGIALTFPLWIGVGLMLLALLGCIALVAVCLTVGAPAWLWAVVGFLFLQGMVLMAMGLQGLYLDRMYEELQNRPLYIVDEIIE